MAEDRKTKTPDVRMLLSKVNNSSITAGTLVKLHVHNHTMVIYIQYEFHEIASIGWLPGYG